MKKILIALGILSLPIIAWAQLSVPQGGTGVTSIPQFYIPYGSSQLHTTSANLFQYNPTNSSNLQLNSDAAPMVVSMHDYDIPSHTWSIGALSNTTNDFNIAPTNNLSSPIINIQPSGTTTMTGAMQIGQSFNGGYLGLSGFFGNRLQLQLSTSTNDFMGFDAINMSPGTDAAYCDTLGNERTVSGFSLSSYAGGTCFTGDKFNALQLYYDTGGLAPFFALQPSELFQFNANGAIGFATLSTTNVASSSIDFYPGGNFVGAGTAPVFIQGLTGQFNAPSVRNGEIADVHADGSVNYTLATTSSDIGRGTALQTAISLASSGDTLYLSANTFDLNGNNLTMPADTALIGSGRHATIIESTFSSVEYAIIDIPNASTTISDLSVIGTDPNASDEQIAIGETNDLDLYTSSVIRNVFASSSNPIHIENGIGNNDDANHYTYIYDSYLAGSDSALVIVDPQSVYVYDSYLTSNNLFYGGSSVVHSVASSIYLFNDSIISSYRTSCGGCVGAASSVDGNSYIYINGGIISTPTGGTDLEEDSGAYMGVTANTSYNPSKTSGTITYSDNRQLRYSIGSSGASSTVLINQNGVANWQATSSLGLSGSNYWALTGSNLSNNVGTNVYANSTLTVGTSTPQTVAGVADTLFVGNHAATGNFGFHFGMVGAVPYYQQIGNNYTCFSLQGAPADAQFEYCADSGGYHLYNSNTSNTAFGITNDSSFEILDSSGNNLITTDGSNGNIQMWQNHDDGVPFFLFNNAANTFQIGDYTDDGNGYYIQEDETNGFSIDGPAHLGGSDLYDGSGSAGTAGQALTSTGATSKWANIYSSVVTASISGGITGDGCDTADTASPVTIASTTSFTTTPEVFPGNGVFAYSMALTTSKIRTYVCSDVTVTPNASTYVVKILN